VPKGIQLNIQVGNDNLSSFANSSTNYISPLSFFGNYDFTYSMDGECYQARTSDQLANPFTGYHLLQLHAINYIDPNGTVYDKIYNKEYVLPKDVFFNDSQIYSYYPIFGNQYDIFPVDSKVSVSTNPTPSSVLTYRTPNRYNNTGPYSTPQSNDNRYIFLNGISIEVLEQKQNGDIRIRLLWDDFDVNDDVRWRGPIVLKESINLKANKIIELDQGLTPSKPVNPITFQGEKIFADPTVFMAKDSSYFNLEINSKLNVKNNSVLILEPGSLLELTDGACLTVYEGSTLQLQDGSSLHISGTGRVEIKDGGYICIENGADITLQDALSVINLRTGSSGGVNTNVIPDPGTCMASPENASWINKSICN